MKISVYDKQKYQEFFSGNIEAFGRHIPSNKVTSKSGKNKKEGVSYTVTEKLTPTNYSAHLQGEVGLGVIPLNSEGEVKFIVVDVDTYDKKYTASLIKKVYFNKLPLVPFRSKSGGLHLYLFFKEFYLCKPLREAVLQMLPALGLDSKTEVFPKQIILKAGQVGSWINLPYFNVNSQKVSRGLIKENMTEAYLTEALTIIQSKLLTEEDLLNTVKSLDLSDAPPCLQHIFYDKEVAQRNDYLFGLATYLKAKEGEDFDDSLLDYNNKLNEPLPTGEVNFEA